MKPNCKTCEDCFMKVVCPSNIDPENWRCRVILSRRKKPEEPMKTTVTPEIKISVVDLHTSCPVSQEIKKLKDKLESADRDYCALVDENDDLKNSLVNFQKTIDYLKGANASLSRDNTDLKTVNGDLKKLCEAYQKDAIMHHERRARAIDLLKIVRDSAESQVDVINDFL